MEGIILVDKPEGWTSFDVVNYTRKIVAAIEEKKPRHVKVGHTGTLDPAATGLLVLCVGRNFTKKVPELIKKDKTYVVELTLGQVSTTGDKEGEITVVNDNAPSKNAIEKILKSFIGDIMQTPPAFSAVKINGKRAYELARAGKEVHIEPREVTIYSITGVGYEYPHITFTASVGSGTYIRSLAEDIGSKLGTGAYMSQLRRTTVGEYSIEQAFEVSELDEENLQKALALNR